MRYTILFVSFFLLIVSVNSYYGGVNCACHQSPRWTRDCCGPTGGYFLHRKCYRTFGFSFVQCCQQVGLRGVCVA